MRLVYYTGYDGAPMVYNFCQKLFSETIFGQHCLKTVPLFQVEIKEKLLLIWVVFSWNL